MVIRRSSAGEVSALLHDLEQGDGTAREAALARLSVIGTRAVEGLVTLARSGAAPVEARAAALAALEAIGDPRAIDPAFDLLASGADAGLALPAAGVLRRALDGTKGTDVLDRLAAMALDVGKGDAARLAALHALDGLPPRVLEPIRERLRRDEAAIIRAAASSGEPTAEIDPLAAIEAAAGGQLPDDPESIRRWLGAAGNAPPLPVLHRLVERIRARESRSDAPSRSAWMTARASVHLALAERGSPVALYDLRETIESGVEGPVEMLTALAAIGDRSCLEPIATAYERMSGVQPGPGRSGERQASDWWRKQLGSAFRAIAERERITERHAVARRIRARWPAAALELLGPARGGR